MPAPDTLPTWRALEKHRRSLSSGKSAANKKNGRRPLHFCAAGIHAELSGAIDGVQTLKLLLRLAREAGLQQKIAALFAGETVNHSERQAALHPLLRTADLPGPALQGVYRQMQKERRRTENLAQQIRSGERRGYTGEAFSDVVHVGIGGSLLGPRLLVDALPERRGGLRCHFLSGIDSAEQAAVLGKLQLERTLFVLASKSATTQETVDHAQRIHRLLRRSAGSGADIHNHFVAVTANAAAMHALGVREDAILHLDPRVGGRYSLWSAMALPLVLRDGVGQWRALLRGAAQMDAHYQNTAPQKNLPLLLGLLDVWHSNFCACQSHAVIPYTHRLRMLPEFLQQLSMESNGKSVRNHGAPANYATAPVLWGGCGTQSQHSFHQLLYQGTPQIAVEFLLLHRAAHGQETQNRELWAHCLAQMQALGGDKRQAQAELRHRENTPGPTGLAPQLAVRKDRPVNLLIMEKLDARCLGALLALWEHRVYTAAAIWDINCFDQWGVELGKNINAEIRAAINSKSGEKPALPTVIEHLLHFYRDEKSIQDPPL